MSWIRFYKIYCYLFLFGLCSCEMDMELGTEEKGVERRYSSYCSNRGECLPTVTCGGSSDQFTISWSGSGDHRFYLSCDGGGHSKSGLVDTSGSWYFDISSQEMPYIVRYTINFDSYYCDKCSKSGSFEILADGTVKEGSHYDCFKEYYSYGISASSDGVI